MNPEIPVPFDNLPKTLLLAGSSWKAPAIPGAVYGGGQGGGMTNPFRTPVNETVLVLSQTDPSGTARTPIP